MPSSLFSSRTYQVVFALLTGALVLTFYHRAEYYDEAWFAEESFWLIRRGQVKSELFRGYNGWENGLYVFHKLFIYAGALIMSVTGISVATSKLVSIGFGFGGGYLVWFYGRNKPREQQWLSVLFYFGCGTLIEFISVNRPETMCMALGFASYLALEPPTPYRPKPIVAGILAGLSALSHLNGLMYLMAGTVWLFAKIGWRGTALFIVAGTLTLSLYGVDALLDGNLPLLVHQFRHDPATQQNFNWTDKLAVLVDYHQIFFHSQNEATLTALVLLCAIAFRKRISLSQPVVFYTLLLILSFWLLTKSNTDIYFLLFLPWLAILAADWLTNFLPDQPLWQRQTARVLLVAFGIISVVQIARVIQNNIESPDIEAHNSLLATYMPQHHTNVIAPIEFFFGQMDTYRIRGLTAYYLLERKENPTPLAAFFQRADQDTVQYIISDHRQNASYDIPRNAPAQLGVYRRVFQDKWNTIYARQPVTR